MPDQPINDTDNIKNVVPSKWTKGACPPAWQDISNVVYSTDNVVYGTDNVIYTN